MSSEEMSSEEKRILYTVNKLSKFSLVHSNLLEKVREIQTENLYNYIQKTLIIQRKELKVYFAIIGCCNELFNSYSSVRQEEKDEIKNEFCYEQMYEIFDTHSILNILSGLNDKVLSKRGRGVDFNVLFGEDEPEGISDLLVQFLNDLYVYNKPELDRVVYENIKSALDKCVIYHCREK